MATLKIVAGNTQWLTNVKRVIAYGWFDIEPDETDDTFSKRCNRALAAAEKAGFHSGGSTVHTVEFENANIGVAIEVYYAGNDVPENWIIPANSCFLMGDNGQTIDRI